MNFDGRVPLTPRDIGLILSYRCRSACAHCLYNCGPNWHAWMPEEEVRNALQTAKAVWGAGFQMHLTGGEPFLNFPLLLASTRIAVELGIPVYAETSASWVRNLDQAEERFRRLREAGMGAILVSVSPFHREAIPLQRTLDGISAARSVFGTAQVMVYQAQWLPELAHYGLKTPVPLERYEKEFGRYEAGLRFWMGFGLIGGGRAGHRLGKWINRRPAEAFVGKNCREELAFAPHSHLDLYGNFIPSFCGGISLGNWHDLAALVDATRREQFTEVVRTLLESGPYGLLELAARKIVYQPLADGYVDKCHLCTDVRQSLSTAGEFLKTFQPPDFYHNM